MRAQVTIAGLLVAGVVGSLIAEWRASSDLTDARSRYEEELRVEARNVRTRVENIFQQSHIALRSITRFPGISKFDPYRGFVPAGIDPKSDLLEYSSSLSAIKPTQEAVYDVIREKIGTNFDLARERADAEGIGLVEAAVELAVQRVYGVMKGRRML